MSRAEARRDRSTLTTWGTTAAAATAVASTAQRPHRTSGRPASGAGTGRTSSAARHAVDSPWSGATAPRRWRSSATTTMRPSTGSTRATERSQAMPSSSTPRATATVVTVTRLVMRPMTNATSDRSRTLKPSAVSVGRPRMPPRRKIVTNASAAAAAHTSVWRRWTGTPSIVARSLSSAAARMAVPAALRRRAVATATITTGTTTMASRSLASKTTPPMRAVASMSASIRSDTRRRSHSRGSRRAPAVSTWLRPMVAMVTSRRDDRAKRRMTTRSVAPPSTTAAARPATTATGHGTPTSSMSR